MVLMPYWFKIEGIGTNEHKGTTLKPTLFLTFSLSLFVSLKASAQAPLFFSENFIAPDSKQGISEFRTTIGDAENNIRYAKLKAVGAKYRQYNFWWSELESSGLASSAAPLKCPNGFTQIPETEADKIKLGFNKYRCVKKEMVSRFDNLFKKDAAHGMQSGVVMWSSPPVYRYDACEGFGFGGNFLKDGCVPRDDAMDDYEDFVNFLASRYNGKGLGKISHFIVWNENNSAEWFDYTPVTKKNSTASDQVEKRIDKYADMLKRTHRALERHQKGSLMYVSTDQLWVPNLHPGNFGTRWLLDGLWTRLGVNYSWSVAVHPYGELDNPVNPDIYTFNNLDMVVKHQVQKLKERGIANTDAYPQSLLIASEQGWPLKGLSGTAFAAGKAEQARQMCMAHDKAMQLPQLVAVAHNYFQSTEPSETEANGQSGQGAFFGLLPNSLPNDLAGAELTATGRAFMSTIGDGWKRKNNHYCCMVYGLGCVGTAPSKIATVIDTHQIVGVVDSLQNNVLAGWACAKGVNESISVHVYAGSNLLGQYKADVSNEAAITEICKSDNPAHRFKISIDPKAAKQFAGMPIQVFGISPLGLDNTVLSGQGIVLPR